MWDSLLKNSNISIYMKSEIAEIDKTGFDDGSIEMGKDEKRKLDAVVETSRVLREKKWVVLIWLSIRSILAIQSLLSRGHKKYFMRKSISLSRSVPSHIGTVEN